MPSWRRQHTITTKMCSHAKFVNLFKNNSSAINYIQNIVTGLLTSYNNRSSEENSYYRISLLIGDDICRIMVGCRWCTHPSIHSFHKITVGCQTSKNIQAFIFFTALTLSRPRPVACRAHFQAFVQNLFSRRGLLGPLCKRKRELWARPPVLTPVPSWAIHSSPPVQTGRLLGPCLETLLRSWLHVKLLGPCFATATMEAPKKLVFLSVTVWEPGTGGQDTETRVRATTHGTTDT